MKRKTRSKQGGKAWRGATPFAPGRQPLPRWLPHLPPVLYPSELPCLPECGLRDEIRPQHVLIWLVHAPEWRPVLSGVCGVTQEVPLLSSVIRILQHFGHGRGGAFKPWSLDSDDTAHYIMACCLFQASWFAKIFFSTLIGHTGSGIGPPLVAQMVRNLPGNAGDLDSMPGLGRSPGEGNGYPLQNSYLENSMDRGAWLATVHRLQRVRMTEWLTRREEVLGAQRLVLESRAICKSNEPSSQGQVPFLHAPGALSSKHDEQHAALKQDTLDGVISGKRT